MFTSIQPSSVAGQAVLLASISIAALVLALGDVAGAAMQTRASADVVRYASEAVDHAVANLGGVVSA